MSAPLNRLYAEPTLGDLLDLVKKEVMLATNCHAIGTIQSFDPSTQTCSATMNYKKTYLEADPTTGVYGPVLVEYPVILDAPVVVIQGGTGYLTMPIMSGDYCLVMFNDRDLDAWLHSGQVSAPNTSRFHSFSDAIILVGLRPNSKALSPYDPARVVLGNGTTLVGVGTSLIKIANNSTTLNTLLQTLISNIQDLVIATSAITVTGVLAGALASGPPANAAAIIAVGVELMATAVQIEGLLE
jgi:hypothetical protein